MNEIEYTVASAFLDELKKIAAVTPANSNGFEKEAAIDTLEAISVEDVAAFLKEAGFWSGVGGLARGAANLGSGAFYGLAKTLGGAARGAGSVAAGVGRGVMGRIKAAPGNLGQTLTRAGDSLRARGNVLEANLANRGAAYSAQLEGRIMGRPAPFPGATSAALTAPDITPAVDANAPAANGPPRPSQHPSVLAANARNAQNAAAPAAASQSLPPPPASGVQPINTSMLPSPAMMYQQVQTPGSSYLQPPPMPRRATYGGYAPAA